MINTSAFNSSYIHLRGWTRGCSTALVGNFGHALFTLCFDFSRRLKRAGQTFSVALDFLAANSNGPYGQSKAFVFKIISLLYILQNILFSRCYMKEMMTNLLRIFQKSKKKEFLQDEQIVINTTKSLIRELL